MTMLIHYVDSCNASHTIGTAVQERKIRLYFEVAKTVFTKCWYGSHLLRRSEVVKPVSSYFYYGLKTVCP